VSSRPSARTAVEHHAEDEFGEEANDAGYHDRDDQEPYVSIANVRQLVSKHGLELGIVESLHEATRYRDGVLPLIEAGGKRVERVGLHDLQLRHRNAA